MVYIYIFIDIYSILIYVFGTKILVWKITNRMIYKYEKFRNLNTVNIGGTYQMFLFLKVVS